MCVIESSCSLLEFHKKARKYYYSIYHLSFLSFQLGGEGEESNLLEMRSSSIEGEEKIHKPKTIETTQTSANEVYTYI